MSFELVEQVRQQSRARGGAKTVQMALAYYPTPPGTLSWPANDTLLRDWGLHEKTVQRAIVALVALGELRPRPDLCTAQRRRVLEITPGHQLCLLPDDVGLSGDKSASVARHLRARVEGSGFETMKETIPPSPPQAGGAAPSLPEIFAQHHQPSTADGSSRAARSRSRQRRDRRGLRAAGPCPLSVLADSEARLLIEETDRLRRALFDRCPEGHRARAYWHERCQSAHLHLAAERLVLGVAPRHLSWVADEFASALSQLAGRPLIVVACSEVAA